MAQHEGNEACVSSVWENVSALIDKQMSHQKGVHVPGLGTFGFSQKKLDIGNNKFLLIQRPVFLLSEKLARIHDLKHTKHHMSGQIPIVQLNFSTLAVESPFDRDTVEGCVKSIIQSFSLNIGAQKNVELSFSGIGRLQIRNSKVKMKFFKHFVTSMDGSGHVMDSLKDRPGTVDSVMTERCVSRPHTSNTMLLPSISQSFTGLDKLDGIAEEEEGAGWGPEEGALEPPLVEGEGDGTERELLDIVPDFDENGDLKKSSPPPGVSSRTPSRVAAPIAKAVGLSFIDDLVPPHLESPKPILDRSPLATNTNPMLRLSLSPLNVPRSASPKVNQSLPEGFEFKRSKSLDRISLEKRKAPSPLINNLIKPPTPPIIGRAKTPPQSACGHRDSGQELCYLCHQREKRNIPVYFNEERKKREQEEDCLLQQYQYLKDTKSIIEEKEDHMAKCLDNQKIAAFNLGVSEGIKIKKTTRPTDFHPSYIFQKRPLTPSRYRKQEEYNKDLAIQVKVKDDAIKNKNADDAFLERLEQVQLAEDLAAQREQYLKDKSTQQDQYKRALSAQLRFKPLPMPARVSDSSEPIFGKNDVTNESMTEKRKRAHLLYKEQLHTVEQQKRDAILQQIAEQRDENDMLKRTKMELRDDRANKFGRMYANRRHLEDEWVSAMDAKKAREFEEKLLAKQPCMILHEQCDKYSRCGQCERKLRNCGESNIWRESRYIPGSRIMV